MNETERIVLLTTTFLSSFAGLLGNIIGQICLSSAFFLIGDLALFYWHLLEITVYEKEDWYNFSYIALTTSLMVFGRFDSCLNSKEILKFGAYEALGEVRFWLPFASELFIIPNAIAYTFVDNGWLEADLMGEKYSPWQSTSWGMSVAAFFQAFFSSIAYVAIDY